MWGFHLVKKNGQLRNGDKREVKLGVKLRARDWYGAPLKKVNCSCGPGMHASPTFDQANHCLSAALTYDEAQYRGGWNVCVVEVTGVSAEYSQWDKFVGLYRTPYIIMGKAEYIRKRAAFRKKNKNGNFDRHLIELAKKTKAKAK